jgi:hypothetical protein
MFAEEQKKITNSKGMSPEESSTEPSLQTFYQIGKLHMFDNIRRLTGLSDW